MAANMEKIKELLDWLQDYKVIPISMKLSDHANVLATLASADQLRVKMVIQVQVLEWLSIEELLEDIWNVEE